MAVGPFLEALSATTPDPGGGAVAALAVTLAAGLCVMTAGLSGRQLPTAEQTAARARLLRDRAAPLAQADAEAYRAVLAALRAQGTAAAGGRPSAPAGPPPPDGASGPPRNAANAATGGTASARDHVPQVGPGGTVPVPRRPPEVAAALSAACAVPMEVAEIGAEVAALAATIAGGGNPNVRGDAIAAALLAAAGSRAAAVLVRINLTGAEADARPARAERLAAEAAGSAAAAERTAP
jgi:formiminotetrahydrofolate cyclodeaminase